MNWEAIGAVAEILGALGVIVTVAYLAMQIRQNSQLVASSLADSIRNGLNEATRIIASDREVARIFRTGVHDRASLSEIDGFQFDALLTLTFYGQQQAFVNNQIDESAALEWLLTLPGPRMWWADYSYLLSSDFRDYVNRLLENPVPGDQR
ncbi:hypothetical protein [Haliea sp. E17]|uniref:hypothetical protein n=1 Tax=Haliea sp. E17 TaxID=3401576 RepID=UPI003AAE70FE